MMMPNGFTYMTDEEKQLLGKIKNNPTAVCGLSRCPSQEFLLTAVFLCPSIIRFVHNQSWWLRMLAVTLDKTTAPYVNGMTPEMRKVADSKEKHSVMDLNMPHYLCEIYANACNMQKCGITSLNKKLVH